MTSPADFNGTTFSFIRSWLTHLIVVNLILAILMYLARLHLIIAHGWLGLRQRSLLTEYVPQLRSSQLSGLEP